MPDKRTLVVIVVNSEVGLEADGFYLFSKYLVALGMERADPVLFVIAVKTPGDVLFHFLSGLVGQRHCEN